MMGSSTRGKSSSGPAAPPPPPGPPDGNGAVSGTGPRSPHPGSDPSPPAASAPVPGKSSPEELRIQSPLWAHSDRRTPSTALVRRIGRSIWSPPDRSRAPAMALSTIRSLGDRASILLRRLSAFSLSAPAPFPPVRDCPRRRVLYYIVYPSKKAMSYPTLSVHFMNAS